MIVNFLSLIFSVIVPNPNVEYGKIVDKRDGKEYRTILVGDRKWMAQNLNYVSDKENWCGYNNEDSCKLYGRFYSWNSAQNVCFPGWHLPKREEFDTLGERAGSVS